MLDACTAVVRTTSERILAHMQSTQAETQSALARVSAAAESGDVEAVVLAHAEAQALTSAEVPPQVRLRTDLGYVVECFDDVPREWLMVDEKRLLAHIKETQGTVPVPGVRITRTERVVTK